MFKSENRKNNPFSTPNQHQIVLKSRNQSKPSPSASDSFNIELYENMFDEIIHMP